MSFPKLFQGWLLCLGVAPRLPAGEAHVSAQRERGTLPSLEDAFCGPYLGYGGTGAVVIRRKKASVKRGSLKVDCDYRYLGTALLCNGFCMQPVNVDAEPARSPFHASAPGILLRMLECPSLVCKLWGESKSWMQGLEGTESQRFWLRACQYFGTNQEVQFPPLHTHP